MWDPNEKKGYIESTINNIGQITTNTQLGIFLKNLAKNENLNSFLEIGTWNGLGSTKCIIDGLKERNSDYIFYSIECNSDKCRDAENFHKNIPNVHILNEVLLNEMPGNIYEIFPELIDNKTYQFWNNVDFENMRDKSLFLNRENLPEIFDVVFLDGGEFTTWYEYLQLKDRCKYLVLDDTNVTKCKRIVSEVKSLSEKWKILMESNERNGFLVAERLI
jgi:hypothetical protein